MINGMSRSSKFVKSSIGSRTNSVHDWSKLDAYPGFNASAL